MGRFYLPAYRAGTEHITDLCRRYPAARLLLVLYGCHGLVELTRVETTDTLRA